MTVRRLPIRYCFSIVPSAACCLMSGVKHTRSKEGPISNDLERRTPDTPRRCSLPILNPWWVICNRRWLPRLRAEGRWRSIVSVFSYPVVASTPEGAALANRLDDERLGLLLHCLVEGNSCRGAGRLSEVALNTVYGWLDRSAVACADFHDRHVRNLSLVSLQADELWGFVYVKAKRIDAAKSPPAFAGDVWTWLALDPVTKLIVACHVGSRGGEDAACFVSDIAWRLDTRVQLSTDGHAPYVGAVDAAFGAEIDFAQLVKSHRTDNDGNELVEVFKNVISGSPQELLISTSLVERLNLTMRMSDRRMIRRTNGFSKRVWRHSAMMQVLVTYYNFCRVHGALKTTPAVAAGLADHVWDRRELARMIIEHGCSVGTRGPYQCDNSSGGLEFSLVRSWGRDRAVRKDVACANCGSHWMPKDGRDASGRQRYRCRECGYRSVGELAVP